MRVSRFNGHVINAEQHVDQLTGVAPLKKLADDFPNSGRVYVFELLLNDFDRCVSLLFWCDGFRTVPTSSQSLESDCRAGIFRVQSGHDPKVDNSGPTIVVWHAQGNQGSSLLRREDLA